MGRVIRQQVVAMRCELRSCGVVAVMAPMAVEASHESGWRAVQRLVEQGWAFVLTPQLRSYCRVHRERVWSCTCRTNPDRRHLCTVHSSSAAELVWWEPVLNSDGRLAA